MWGAAVPPPPAQASKPRRRCGICFPAGRGAASGTCRATATAADAPLQRPGRKQRLFCRNLLCNATAAATRGDAESAVLTPGAWRRQQKSQRSLRKHIALLPKPVESMWRSHDRRGGTAWRAHGGHETGVGGPAWNARDNHVTGVEIRMKSTWRSSDRRAVPRGEHVAVT